MIRCSTKLIWGSVFTLTYEIKTLTFSQSWQEVRSTSRASSTAESCLDWPPVFLQCVPKGLKRHYSWLYRASFCSGPSPLPLPPSLTSNDQAPSGINPWMLTASLHVATFAFEAPVLPLSFPFGVPLLSELPAEEWVIPDGLSLDQTANSQSCLFSASFS